LAWVLLFAIGIITLCIWICFRAHAFDQETTESIGSCVDVE
jgi:hypothetical protein